MHPSAYVVLFGVAVFLAAWQFYRQPGTPFWSQVPPWRATRFLKPVGVWLYAAGMFIGLGGFVWHLAAGTSS